MAAATPSTSPAVSVLSLTSPNRTERNFVVRQTSFVLPSSVTRPRTEIHVRSDDPAVAAADVSPLTRHCCSAIPSGTVAPSRGAAVDGVSLSPAEESEVQSALRHWRTSCVENHSSRHCAASDPMEGVLSASSEGRGLACELWEAVPLAAPTQQQQHQPQPLPAGNDSNATGGSGSGDASSFRADVERELERSVRAYFTFTTRRAPLLIGNSDVYHEYDGGRVWLHAWRSWRAGKLFHRAVRTLEAWTESLMLPTAGCVVCVPCLLFAVRASIVTAMWLPQLVPCAALTSAVAAKAAPSHVAASASSSSLVAVLNRMLWQLAGSPRKQCAPPPSTGGNVSSGSGNGGIVVAEALLGVSQRIFVVPSADFVTHVVGRCPTAHPATWPQPFLSGFSLQPSATAASSLSRACLVARLQRVVDELVELSNQRESLVHTPVSFLSAMLHRHGVRVMCLGEVRRLLIDALGRHDVAFKAVVHKVSTEMVARALKCVALELFSGAVDAAASASPHEGAIAMTTTNRAHSTAAGSATAGELSGTEIEVLLPENSRLSLHVPLNKMVTRMLTQPQYVEDVVEPMLRRKFPVASTAAHGTPAVGGAAIDYGKLVLPDVLLHLHHSLGIHFAASTKQFDGSDCVELRRTSFGDSVAPLPATLVGELEQLLVAPSGRTPPPSPAVLAHVAAGEGELEVPAAHRQQPPLPTPIPAAVDVCRRFHALRACDSGRAARDCIKRQQQQQATETVPIDPAWNALWRLSVCVAGPPKTADDALRVLAMLRPLLVSQAVMETGWLVTCLSVCYRLLRESEAHDRRREVLCAVVGCVERSLPFARPTLPSVGHTVWEADPPFLLWRTEQLLPHLERLVHAAGEEATSAAGGGSGAGDGSGSAAAAVAAMCDGVLLITSRLLSSAAPAPTNSSAAPGAASPAFTGASVRSVFLFLLRKGFGMAHRPLDDPSDAGSTAGSGGDAAAASPALSVAQQVPAAVVSGACQLCTHVLHDSAVSGDTAGDTLLLFAAVICVLPFLLRAASLVAVAQRTAAGLCRLHDECVRRDVPFDPRDAAAVVLGDEAAVRLIHHAIHRHLTAIDHAPTRRLVALVDEVLLGTEEGKEALAEVEEVVYPQHRSQRKERGVPSALMERILGGPNASTGGGGDGVGDAPPNKKGRGAAPKILKKVHRAESVVSLSAEAHAASAAAQQQKHASPVKVPHVLLVQPGGVDEFQRLERRVSTLMQEVEQQRQQQAGGAPPAESCGKDAASGLGQSTSPVRRAPQHPHPHVRHATSPAPADTAAAAAAPQLHSRVAEEGAVLRRREEAERKRRAYEDRLIAKWNASGGASAGNDPQPLLPREQSTTPQPAVSAASVGRVAPRRSESVPPQQQHQQQLQTKPRARAPQTVRSEAAAWLKDQAQQPPRHASHRPPHAAPSTHAPAALTGSGGALLADFDAEAQRYLQRAERHRHAMLRAKFGV